MSPARTCIATLFLVALAGRAVAQPKKLSVVWELETPKALPQAILEDRMGRHFLHVAMKNGGLTIFDTSVSKVAPRTAATIGIAQLGNLDVMNLTQRNDLLFLALGDFFDAKGSNAGLAVVSVATPGKPRILSVWKSKQKLQGAAAVIVKGNYAYVGAMNHGIVVLDITDPGRIKEAATILPSVDFPLKNPKKVQHPNARGFAIQGRYLYVAFDAGGVRVLDIDDPRKPREIGRYINPGMGKKQQAYNNLVIEGTTAYVATDYAGMEILDIRDPRAIKQIAWWNPWEAHTLKNLWFNSPGHTNQIEYDAKRRQVYLSAGASQLLVIDVSRPSKPVLVAQHGEPKDKQGAWGLTISKKYVYLAYIKAVVPFQGTWSGLKALER